MKKTLKERFDEKWIPEPNSGCWLWCASIDKDSYGAFSVNRKNFRAHRMSYQIYCEEIPENKIIRHKCDNRLCVNPDHLEIGRQSDNISDMMKRGRQAKGTSKPNCKLSEDQVLNIFKDNRSHYKIAEEYNVTRRHISKIKSGLKWGWLTNSLLN